MEPLVHTISCPNCAEAILALCADGAAKCESCGFDAEVFSDRTAAFDRFQSCLVDAAVIVTDPVEIGKSRWVIAHTRMMLV